MTQRLTLVAPLLVFLLVSPAPLRSHGGGLDLYGCHHNRIQGDYHCHRGVFAGAMFDSQAEMLQQLGERSSAAETAGHDAVNMSQQIHAPGHCLKGCPVGPAVLSDLIIRDIYVLANDFNTKFATWVAYRISRDTIGSTKPRSWKADPLLDPVETLEPPDYEGAHAALQTDRGHQVPLASFTGTPHWQDTNYLSNITPQGSALNQGPWARLESAARNLARQPGVAGVYGMTGPLYERPMPPLPNADEPHSVPSVSTDDISHQISEIESPLSTGDNVPSPLTETEEGRMLRKEDFMVIQALAQQGLYLQDIAKQVGVHPRTVRRALDRGGAPPRRIARRGRRLDPYRADIDRLLAEDVWNAVVIYRELQAKGYTGRLSILRDYIRPKRALRVRRATVRFETEPGRQLQSDWAEHETRIAGEPTTVHFIANTLGFSRRFHFWCTDSEDAEHTFEGLIRSFEWFGGVPGEVLVDNQKAAVLEHPRGGPARFHPRFVDLAGHYGFVPRACRPARAQTKGKDERMVGYVKHHFFVRYRDFACWAHLNQLAEQWLQEEADPRVHGTVHEIVAERFAREAPTLRPLPPQRYDTAYREMRQVSWDAYIDVRGRRYSVPAHLAGRPVAIRLTLDGQLTVFDGDQVVATHRMAPGPPGWVTVPAHHAALWAHTLEVERRPLAAYEEVTS